LSAELGSTEAEDNDGTFFMPFKAYLRHFERTSFCLDIDPDKFQTQQAALVDLHSEQNQSFFCFSLKEDYDVQAGAFAISAV